MSTKTKASPSNNTASKAKTSVSKTTKAKSTSKPKETAGNTTAKTPVSAPAPAATVVDAPQPVILGPVLRKRELINLVVTRSGIKKKDAKPVVEAVLATLGEALADGRELILPPMGRMMIRKERMVANARIMTLKVRQSTGSPSAEEKEANSEASAKETPAVTNKKPEPETV